MQGFALTLAALAMDFVPVEIPKDVLEFSEREFRMTLKTTQTDAITQMRLYVSTDQGKTWKHVRDYRPTAKFVQYKAPRDGQYWFSIQLVLKDGTSSPAQVKDLTPLRKLYINTRRRALKPKKSYEELERETRKLRREVEELRKRVRELTGGRRMEPVRDE